MEEEGRRGQRKRKSMAMAASAAAAAAASPWCLIFTIAVIMLMYPVMADDDLSTRFDVIWGGVDGHTRILENGKLLTISLDKVSGGAVMSKRDFLYARISMKIKLIPGNSAGTVTSFYMSSGRPGNDEIDFEFLGNVSGEPYTIHTNVFTLGKGDREMQFKPWFDPTADFHTYTILWNPLNIIFYVDAVPIRVFENKEQVGLPFPSWKPMTLRASLWNSDYWATQNGKVKTNWTLAPFIASFRDYEEGLDFDDDTMIATSTPSSNNSKSWMSTTLNPTEMQKLQWVHTNYLIYNYCTDKWRFPIHSVPPECILADSSS